MVEVGGLTGWLYRLPPGLCQLPSVCWLVAAPGRQGTQVKSVAGIREVAQRFESSLYPDDHWQGAWWRAVAVMAAQMADAPGPAARVVDDCCVAVAFTADPVLTIGEDELDPFTGETVAWPYPRVYWSNGVVTDGQWRYE